MAMQKPYHKKVITTIPKRGALSNILEYNTMGNWLMVLVAILPFLFSSETLDPTLSVRYLFLSGFILLFTFLFGSQRKIVFDLSWPTTVKTVFILGISYSLWAVMTSMFSINISTALYEIARYTLNVILLFLVMVTVQQELSLVLNLCKVLVIVSIIQSLVGIFQYYEVAFTDIPGTDKPYGLMVHRTLFGSAQALLTPFLLFVVFKASKGWKFISLIALAGVVVSIIISQSRSAWLATIAVILTTLILTVTYSKHYRKKFTLAILTGISAIIIALVILVNLETGDRLSKSIIGRFTTIVQAPSDYNAISTGRLLLWSKSLRLFKRHLISGVGPGNWHLAIPVYTSTNSAWADGGQVPSWPHNIYIQVACETGIPGFLLYFSMYLLLFLIGLKVVIKSKSEDVRILNILMLSGLAAFATDGMFSFPTERIEHSLYLTLMGGIMLGSFLELSKLPAEKPQSMKQWFVILILVISGFNLFMSFKKYNFESHMKLAKNYRMEHRYWDIINEVEEGKSIFVTLDPIGEPLEMQSSAAYVELKDYEKALSEIQTAKKYHPNSGRIWTTMGVVYAEMQHYEKSVECYQHALRLIPDYDIALQNLAKIYFRLGNYAACITTIERVSVNNKSSLKEILEEAQRRLNGK